jgi:hypothetical protein
MKVRVPILIVLAVGFVGTQPVLGARQAYNSNGLSASAVFVRSGNSSNCSNTNLVDNQIGYNGDIEVVIKSYGNVENMRFNIVNNGNVIEGGDLDVLAYYCGSNGVYTIAALDVNNNEDPENLDDDNFITSNYSGSITVEILENGKKFGSDSLRIG